jgi:predicted nucleic acid-binding protein
MTTFVVDASVGVKWLELFAGEPLAREALELLERRTRHEVEMLVPDLFWLEVANVLCKAVHKNACTPTDAKKGLALLTEQALRTISSRSLLDSALEIAIRYRRSMYDSIYAALAHASGSQLVTADEKLANALAAHLPVKWLGAV